MKNSTVVMVFYGLTLLGLAITGVMMLGWYLTPPHPDRVGYWFIVIVVGYPLLGMSGLMAFALHRELELPVWLGASLVGYPAISVALMALSGLRPLASALDGLLSLPGGFEGLQVLIWALMCVAVGNSLFHLTIQR